MRCAQVASRPVSWLASSQKRLALSRSYDSGLDSIRASRRIASCQSRPVTGRRAMNTNESAAASALWRTAYGAGGGSSASASHPRSSPRQWWGRTRAHGVGGDGVWRRPALELVGEPRTASLEFCRRGPGCIHARAGDRRGRSRRPRRQPGRPAVCCTTGAVVAIFSGCSQPAFCWVTGTVIAIWRRERLAPSTNLASGRNARSGASSNEPPTSIPATRCDVARTRLGDPPPHAAAARSSLPPRRDDRAAATLSRPACASFG
jgi:hypothetical protein